MKTIFKLLSLFPRDLLRSVLKLLLKLGIFKNTASYKLTNINLKLVFEEKSNQEITNLTNKVLLNQ